MSQRTEERLRVIAGLREIADCFDHVLVDQWGVLHTGGPVLPAARACLGRLRAAGKTIAILSNSGRRAAANARRLTALGLPGSDYDFILTSGEAVWRGLAERVAPPYDRLGRRCFLVSRGGDRSIVEGLDLEIVPEIGPASFILLAGLDDDPADPAIWRPIFTAAAGHGVPLLCANPDLTMFAAGGLVPGAGAMAALYEALGGTVHYIGKPHRLVFDECLVRLGRPPGDRVLVVGDSLHHDIVGGSRAGLLTALVTGGVHAPDLAGATTPTALAEAVDRLAEDAGARPNWILPALTW
jgi:HAD superfamily hydrolase (TIGR01459 family)